MLKFFRNMMSQRGAMFGLDARMALAIFGTIAVVSGYMGISKLTTANRAAFIKEVLAYEDAIQQIQTDVGVFYQFAIAASNGVTDFNAIEFNTNIAAQYRPRWNGPYIEGIRQDHPQYGSFTLTYRQENGTTVCNISNNCYVWLFLTNVPAEVWAELNKYIDENNGTAPEGTPISEGRVRADGATATRELRFRTKAMRRAG